ncbi:amino acid ABC transporter permease [Maridesulfovibrio zosterae]|uniref:amino acid ABC transporter permease n=1 Tax=Maridesulfovibrio zosterae TaxID=82171 RepID=UPI00040EAEB7|nr:amino acid ABC transporter permease [Maridesulfovibrio zosterae]
MGEKTLDHSQGRPWVRLLNDARFRGWVSQAVVLALIIAGASYGISNVAQNLHKAGITTGFGFLSSPAGFDISQTLIPYTSKSSYADALLVGVLNTLLVSALSIVFSSILGLFLGIIRLSPNWLVSHLAGAYTEMIRNVPLLLQILFWYLAILAPLPGPRKSLDLGGIIYLCNRGLQIPSPEFLPGFGITFAVFLLATAISIALIVWNRRRQRNTGKHIPAYLISLCIIIVLPMISYYTTGSPVHWDIPKLKGFNFSGGITVLPELIALTLALSLYSATFIGEYIRSGIMAVNKGQTEAAYALGYRPGLAYRLIIIPQAMRVAIPPLISQYLTLIKNSSLAVVIGYPDLIHVFAGTALNQSGQSVEIISITMIIYLSLSLVISLFMNWYNKKFAMRGY